MSELFGSICTLHLSTGSKGLLKRVRLLNSADCTTNPSRAIEQNSRLIALLKGLTVHVDHSGHQKINEVLNLVCFLESNTLLVLIRTAWR